MDKTLKYIIIKLYCVGEEVPIKALDHKKRGRAILDVLRIKLRKYNEKDFSDYTGLQYRKVH